MPRQKNHSCKWSMPLPGMPGGGIDPAKLVWRTGAVCATVNGLFWQIKGRYREMVCEPDVLASEAARQDVVEGIVRLSHYVLDASTPVHLLPASNEVHGHFEKALDDAMSDALRGFAPVSWRKARSAFLRHCTGRRVMSGYDAADNVARLTAARFAPDLAIVYPDWSAKRVKMGAARSRKLAALSRTVVAAAAQNLLDMYAFLWERRGGDAGLARETLGRGDSTSL
ncbi:MAG: hypothetical protein QME96_05180 [Myxococcota bacterium]|nr:hypothetical protein [Myxococcota bacterium]